MTNSFFIGVVEGAKGILVPILESERKATRVRALMEMTAASQTLLVTFSSFKRNLKKVELWQRPK